MLTRLGRCPEALQDWDRAIGLGHGLDLELRLGRASTLAAGGDHAAAVAEADDLAGCVAAGVGMVERLARLYSLAASAARQDLALSDADREELADRYAARGEELLEQVPVSGASSPAGNEPDGSGQDPSAVSGRVGCNTAHGRE
jgi:hypothetical protein